MQNLSSSLVSPIKASWLFRVFLEQFHLHSDILSIVWNMPCYELREDLPVLASRWICLIQLRGEGKCLGDTPKDVFGAVQGGGACAWMLADTGRAGAAPSLGQPMPPWWGLWEKDVLGCCRLCWSLPFALAVWGGNNEDRERHSEWKWPCEP